MAGGYLKLQKRLIYLLFALKWFLPGCFVFYLGIKNWATWGFEWWILVWLAVSLAMFSSFIFPRSAKKDIKLVESHGVSHVSIYKCIELKTLLIIACMVTLGIHLRKNGVVPHAFIAGFYTGLGFSLMTTALRYHKHIMPKRENQ